MSNSNNSGFTPNTNNGALFTNDRRQNDKSPNFKGSAEIECPHCGAVHKTWLSAWKKVSRASVGFLSLAFTPDNINVTKAAAAVDEFDLDAGEQRPLGVNPIKPPTPKPAPAPQIDFDDDIPF